jgi:AcrR family transcriptional regulator
MAKADRRSQLLDVAADLVVARGPAAVTIERVAAEADVSRALAYQHFDNAEEVLVALYQREVASLGEAIMAAVALAEEPEAKVRAAVQTFCRVVGSRHGLFTVLAAAGSTIPAKADDGTRAGHRFTEALFEQAFGMSPRRARVAAAVTLGALHGGIEAWAAGELRRREVEDAAVEVIMAFAPDDRR